MKKIKKIISIMLVAVMALAMSMTAFAQEEELAPVDPDSATITIKNPAKGETYTLYKLFDATTKNGAIAYQSTGDIPEVLSEFFTKDSANNVIPTEKIATMEDGKITAVRMTEELKTALNTWANSGVKETVSAISKGDTLEFTGLPYGYYVMTTTHESDANKDEEAKSAITVTSTQPDATISDKNVNKPNAVKTVEKESYSIGDTVKYTATFDTTNYMGEGENAKQVVNYVIYDTLPEFLSNVKIKSIRIGSNVGEDGKLLAPFEYESTNEQGFGDVEIGETTTNNAILIPWAKGDKGNYTSSYTQGVKIQIEYEAVLTSTTNINADDKNTITIQPYVDDGGDNPDPWSETWHDDAVIRTYAAAINKLDQDENPLAGATFKIKGLTVTPVEKGTGVYRVVSYDPANNAAESVELSTNNEGKLYIVGLASDVRLTVTEFKAPDGYNKLTETKELIPQVMEEIIYETSGERYYDADGNLVSEAVTEGIIKNVENNLNMLDVNSLKITNNKGTLLPDTGGIGTTIFYIVGAILVIGAGIILVAKKRMSHEQ